MPIDGMKNKIIYHNITFLFIYYIIDQNGLCVLKYHIVLLIVYPTYANEFKNNIFIHQQLFYIPIFVFNQGLEHNTLNT